MTTLYKFKATFTKLGIGTAPSPAPVATVVDTDADTKLVDAQASTAKSSLPGHYEYEYEGADNLDLVCRFHTDDTATDQQDLDSYVVDKVYQADAKLDVIDGIVDDILVDTGTDIPASIATAQADLDNPDQYKADVSALALEATLDAIKGVSWTDEDLVAIKAAVDAIESAPTPTEVWSAPERRLTMTATEIIASVSGSSITQIRGNTWDIELTDVTLDGNKQQFAVKRSSEISDEDATLLIDSEVGLLRVNGVAVPEAENSKAILTYTAAEKKLNIHLDAYFSAQMPAKKCVYGAQGISSGGVVGEPYIGDFIIVADVFRAIE